MKTLRTAMPIGRGGCSHNIFQNLFSNLAAERRQSVAPGASPGFSFETISAPEGRKTLSPLGGWCAQNDTSPGLAPGATLCRRSAASHGIFWTLLLDWVNERLPIASLSRRDRG